MFAAKNLLLAGKAATGSAHVAYDTSAQMTGVTGGSASFSLPLNAAGGADVFLVIQTNTTSTLSAVEFNGTPLTLLATVLSGNEGGQGYLYVYHGHALGTASLANATFTVSAQIVFCAAVASYTGVSTIGSPITKYGISTTPSSGAISLGSGAVIFCALGSGDYIGQETIGSPTGGTNRQLINSDATVLAVSDSTISTTFGATLSASRSWDACALVLS